MRGLTLRIGALIAVVLACPLAAVDPTIVDADAGVSLSNYNELTSNRVRV